MKNYKVNENQKTGDAPEPIQTPGPLEVWAQIGKRCCWGTNLKMIYYSGRKSKTEHKGQCRDNDSMKSQDELQANEICGVISSTSETTLLFWWNTYKQTYTYINLSIKAYF